jgi:7,8-dihydroneopterin aldolase/epimerase/oxygenase
MSDNSRHDRPRGDAIEISGLAIHAFHGCFDAERELGQRFVLDVMMHADLAKAGASDDLADTLDYGAVTARITHHFTSRPFRLIEAAAHHVAMSLLAEFPTLNAIRLKLHKPNAPIKAHFTDVACIVERWRDS